MNFFTVNKAQTNLRRFLALFCVAHTWNRSARWACSDADKVRTRIVWIIHCRRRLPLKSIKRNWDFFLCSFDDRRSILFRSRARTTVLSVDNVSAAASWNSWIRGPDNMGKCHFGHGSKVFEISRILAIKKYDEFALTRLDASPRHIFIIPPTTCVTWFGLARNLHKSPQHSWGFSARWADALRRSLRFDSFRSASSAFFILFSVFAA